MMSRSAVCASPAGNSAEGCPLHSCFRKRSACRSHSGVSSGSSPGLGVTSTHPSISGSCAAPVRRSRLALRHMALRHARPSSVSFSDSRESASRNIASAIEPRRHRHQAARSDGGDKHGRYLSVPTKQALPRRPDPVPARTRGSVMWRATCHGGAGGSSSARLSLRSRGSRCGERQASLRSRPSSSWAASK